MFAGGKKKKKALCKKKVLTRAQTCYKGHRRRPHRRPRRRPRQGLSIGNGHTENAFSLLPQ